MLPKIDTPVYDITLPLSKKKIRFRPFLVKEQKNLLMAMESSDKEAIEENIKQVLHNCTLTENIDVQKLPVLDVEYYFLQLRARSVGEIVENKYKCEIVSEETSKPCGNIMDAKLNLLDIQVEGLKENNDLIQLTPKVSIKMKYPEFSVLKSLNGIDNVTDIALELVADSIEYITEGENIYYTHEVPKKEVTDFIESLNAQQFAKIETFFTEMPRLKKTVEMKCSRCGFQHTINVEGLESFFE